MDKVLFLDNDLDEFGSFFRKKRNDVNNLTSEKIFISKFQFLRKCFIYLGLKLAPFFMYFSYGKWKFKINNYDYFIIPSRRSSKFALWLLRKKKVTVYYWNLITSKEISPDYIRKKYPNVKLCTFDKLDSEKYGILFVDTYYFNLKNEFGNYYESDFFYVGGMRPGREILLNEIKNIFGSNYKYDFNLIQFNDFNKGIEYSEVVKRIQKTRVIVDLTRENQTGLTLRPLEALIFQKKLITNNINVIKYPFYKKNNIYILGYDDNIDLNIFLTSQFENVDNSILEYYYFENWLSRVLNI